MRSRTRLHPRYRWLVAALVLVPTAIATPWMIVRGTTASDTQPADASFDHADAAVVLGARVYADGRPSRFLRERVETGVQLYLDGTVDRLIMSGDGSDSSGFGEPSVMRQVAENMGVPPEAIEEDPLGVDTYSSCVNARDTFGASSVIMVSQEFHVPRAVWVCDRIGLSAQGAYPPQRLTKSTLTGHVREIAADAKAMLDVWSGRVPDGTS
ncbi:YdcF family protein [Demequina sp. TTPB684]|uniref:SanA/YdcF family protein n=1 Tax=unclassified Demequina TaxID=2620311 RepID=UPI001CF46694|nr:MULTISPECIES: ElyC/SanA/YdcF family protein [unclassified Demequina]MCB2413532.1 YdcF family protein [Demequina sp. TTPB684]UPU87246.1 YdcF family protein [Demequina sp. TMPB413]